MEPAGSQPSSYSLLEDDDDEFKMLPPMPGIRLAPHLKYLPLSTLTAIEIFSFLLLINGYGRRWATDSGGRRPFDYLEEEDDDDDYILLSPSTYTVPETETNGLGKRIRKVFGC
ncbi:unnamed protein product [Colletotrichum noveboracense]|uniref:Uncharacterized protein n=1 Tax=Colletotrichum noveboracense TaxID=2664923 RepID=A0A9W4RVK3_9PEZI|nr:unnamed protein product [Colletotrichum noveboracense]